MNEGEKKNKKVYKHGDIVTFRLLKKIKYSDDVIDLINRASQSNELNREIIKALELYAKYQKYNSSFTITKVNESEERFFNKVNTIESKGVSAPDTVHEDNVFEDIAIDVIKSNNNTNTKIDIKSKEDKVIVIDNWGNNDNSGPDSAEDELFASNSDNISRADGNSKSGMAKAFKNIRRR